MRPVLVTAVLVGLLVAGSVATPVLAQEWKDYGLVLRVGDQTWKYSQEQLKAMATKTFLSNRGKPNVAVPVDALIEKDPKLPLARVSQVIFVGAKQSLLVEGEHLAQLKHLLLKFGPNHLTLVPETDEAYRALRPVWRKAHLEGVQRVDVQWQ